MMMIGIDGNGSTMESAVRASRPCIPQLIGDSPALASVREAAASVASRHCTVLILGPTGSGKEVLARYIHSASRRSNAPFIPVDCAALGDALFESQMFGHVRGAFTGAMRDSVGYIRAAEGGTLFLDELGELSLSSQAKLLRVIQERAVVPVGETRPRPVDIRLLAATHRNLSEMVQEGTFRQDLFYRLNVIALELPPLRERPEDILPLAEHFLQQQAQRYEEPCKRLSSGAGTRLRDYGWPGNVRELANAMERAHISAPGEEINPSALPPLIALGTAEESVALEGELLLENAERRLISEALRRTRANKAAACRLLGIDVKRLRRRMTRLGISPTRHRASQEQSAAHLDVSRIYQ